MEPLLTVFSVAVGWYVVHRLSKARDLDKMLLEAQRDSAKEKREAAREMLKQLRELEARGVKFHTSVAYDEPNAHELVRLYEQIVRELAMWQTAEMAKRIYQLRQALTLNNFDQGEFIQQTLDSDIVIGIRYRIGAVEKELLPQTRLWSPPKTIEELRRLK
jgi:hypothetical protein